MKLAQQGYDCKVEKKWRQTTKNAFSLNGVQTMLNVT